MKTRESLLQTVKNILIGPNPLPGYTQENGEEILFYDSPLKTYVSGVLFPQSIISDRFQESESSFTDDENREVPDETIDPEEKMLGQKNVPEPIIEAETSKINSYRQSAMGITLCIPNDAQRVILHISVGAYDEKKAFPPKEKKVEGEKKIISDSKEKICYYRKPVVVDLIIDRSQLPNIANRYSDKYIIKDSGGNEINGLGIGVTFRLTDHEKNYTIYTFTLINKNKCLTDNIKVSECWFQCIFSVRIDKEFYALPSGFCAEINDYDYKLNSLLYRDVKTYGIGHGCAATWDDKSVPNEVSASVLPEYEVKPIVPAQASAKLSMSLYADNKEATLVDLRALCDEYKEWIDSEEKKISDIKEKAYAETAERQIELCRLCLKRMENGIALLSSNALVWRAFSLANRAMLMQQLHYKMPLIEYKGFNKKSLSLELAGEIKMPDFNDESTWYNRKTNDNPDGNIYGLWRPFQIAFLLMNLESISDKKSEERKIVDLIWFPTGGGKTEAYLGLTAFTIFLRRLKNPNDSGTAVIMRYTLRLLTAQQYERAASLICAIEKLRSEYCDELGDERITIGLYVGDSLTENNSSEVIRRIRDIRAGANKGNVSVVLKCPWCGASMGTFIGNDGCHTPGYEIENNRVLFKCGNSDCDFGDDDYTLPLALFDDEIYKNPPTLLFGTVDKFAMLPYKPEAKNIFGGDNERTPPELIIQDELHLITGPLGSTVGLYETLIDALCVKNGYYPKVIASTATISHAKQQCNALYGCGQENVFQFPVQGTSYKDCFFAHEDREQTGRKYVGLYASAASSSATASIYTFAAFLYAAKAIKVLDEKERDPYWTNLAYFGSMRELGQAATWYIADIKERLEVLYSDRLQVMDGDKRRYIYESGLAELTSRMGNDDIPKILKRLEVEYSGAQKQKSSEKDKEKNDDKRPLDVCLATNMVSVGVDISRLGLMTVTGQPKSMSEYIQATSRVGRAKAPGLVFVIYNTAKTRDKSHYEKFQSQHAKLYYSVEPTSVTPFSRPLRERALPAVFAALHRFFVNSSDRYDAKRYPTQDEFREIVETILSRASGIDPEECVDIKLQLERKYKEWQDWRPEKYNYSIYNMGELAPLLCQAGTARLQTWEERGWESPTSMRNVDRECGLDCSKSLIIPTEDD